MIVKITILSNDCERVFLPCVTTCNPSAVCILKFTFCSVEDLISDKIIYVMVCSPESVDSVCRDGTDMPYVATVVRLYGFLTFIREYSVTTKIAKVASNHRGSTKLEFVKTAKLFIFFFLLFQTARAI